ncbi:MAG: exosortase/archaeosortase family protein [Candidatus Micrarchaeota archaeon]|nr:exosortase/archaeosortase family protein [Candidatus Micrarchaeota archaeon]
MRFDAKGRAGILFLFLAVIIMIVGPLGATNPNIDNSDVSSYVVVPIMMLPLLGLFIFKRQVEGNREVMDLAIGIAVFAVFVILTVLLSRALPYYFQKFRLDMLLFPIGIAGIVVTMFGRKSLRNFLPLVAYPALASPLVLFYLLGTNGAFAQANTFFVYLMVHAFSSGVTYSPPFTIDAGNYAIGVGTSCAGVAIFIALLMFLLPIAYLFDGKMKDRLYWVVSGIILLLLLNFVRMAGVAIAWIAYGPSASVSFVHSFAGMLLFYISIIAMIILLRRYGLEFPAPTRRRRQAGRSSAFELYCYGVAVILALSYLGAAWVF